MRPDVSARSTKNGPKLLLARSRVPRSELNKYVKPLDEVLIGNVASSISSAREIVSRVAAVASASFSMSPCTDCLVGQEERQHLTHGLLGEGIRWSGADQGREGDDGKKLPAISSHNIPLAQKKFMGSG